MDLVIFHYHLLPGGVTTVIRQSVQSLRAHCGEISRIRVVAGRVPENAPALRGCDVVRCPEIDYTPVRPLSGVLWKERVQRLTDTLTERFGGNGEVWWIHNYHLGKNPLFTEAVLRLACSPSGPRMILQPHDFPEAGRYRNLAALDNLVGLPLYPCGPRVRYALINGRDLRLLKNAGVPASRLFLLENPVAPPGRVTPWGDDKRGIRSLLFPGADPGHATLLYPVRSIRRKNVLEAGILLRLLDVPLRLIVTLPGVSKPEKAYSETVEDAFRRGLIPGEIGAGVRRADLRIEQLAAACDLVVSSSVQEGFGYLFVQALQWGLPLLARRLETIPGADGLYDGYPAFFYGDVRCPLDASDTARLLERYRDKLRRIRGFLPAGAEESMEKELAGRFAQGPADFSFLDPLLQMQLLEAAAERSGYRQAVREENAALARGLDGLLAEQPAARARAVEERFGLPAYASRVRRLLDSFAREGPETPEGEPARVQQKMRAAFARAEHVRLLYD